MMVPVLVLISIIGFCLAFVLPGDPAEAILPDELQGDKVAYEALRAELGLDSSVPVQYWRWAKRAVTGNFGLSPRNAQHVTDAIVARLAPTAELTILSL
jgi:peptide/nickel transport system permease protein